jgi:hypothetical protein
LLAVPLAGNRVADDHHRAGRVMDAMLPGRSQQRLHEAAVAADADNQEISAGGRIQQCLGGVPLATLYLISVGSAVAGISAMASVTI